MQWSTNIPATVLRILTPTDRKFPFPWDCNGTVGALKVSFIIIRSGVVVPELSLKFTSSAGVVAAVAIKYSCFGCRARTFITICAICKPQNCFNKELVRCLSGLRRILIVYLHPMLCWWALFLLLPLEEQPQQMVHFFPDPNTQILPTHRSQPSPTIKSHSKGITSLALSFLCLQIRNSPRGCTCVTILCSGISPLTASCEFPPPRRRPTIWTRPLSVAPPPERTPGTRTCCLPCTCISIVSPEREEVGLLLFTGR